MHLSRSWPRASRENRIAVADPIARHARAAQGPNATEWDLVALLLTVRLRASSGRRGTMAQSAGAARRYRFSGQARQSAAAAVATAGAGGRLPSGRGFGAN